MFNHRTTGFRRVFREDVGVFIRTSRTHLTFWNTSEYIFGKKRALAAATEHTKGDRPRPSPGRVERGEQGEARPGNSAPRDGPQLELFFRSRLSTWSKTDP